MRRIFLLPAAIVCVAFMTAPAAAETATQYETRVVFGDLNLDRRAGADAFLSRVNRAARNACGARTGVVPLQERRMVRECVRDFRERAVASLRNETVTARFVERGGRVPEITVAAR